MGTAASCKLDVTPFPRSNLEGNVGLDVEVVNGSGRQLTLLPLAPGRRYYINHLRFQVSQRGFPAPDVVDWLAAESELAAVDWSGLTQVRTEFSQNRDKTFRELRPYLNAAWMEAKTERAEVGGGGGTAPHEHDLYPEFQLEFYDAAGTLVAGPLALRGDDFVINRRSAIAWVDSEPQEGDYGANSSTYPDVDVASGGAFVGARNDVYTVQVATAGPLDGTAKVDIASARGDAVKGVPVQSGAPIDLGAAGNGATITFTDNGATPTTLVKGDRWVVRCTAGDTPVVGAATPGTKASFTAVAEIRLQYPHSHDTTPFELPDTTTELRVTWASRPDTPYVVPITFAPAETTPGYGLQVQLRLTPDKTGPGDYYEPGEKVTVTLDLLDEDGNPLHGADSLPTYREYMAGQSNGIQYYNLANDPGAEHFTEGRLNLMRLALYGPKHLMKQRYAEDEDAGFFVKTVNLPDVTKVVNAGLAPGSTAWDTPIANSAEIELPADAPPGTYLAGAKVARWAYGQRLYQVVHVPLQVGSAEPTELNEDVGNCEVCHTGEAHLQRLRHGVDITNPKICGPCHTPPRAITIAVAVHEVHFFSSLYPVRKSGCSLCHLKAGSNGRASQAVCGACHGPVHVGEDMVLPADEYSACGQTCHAVLPEAHVVAGRE